MALDWDPPADTGGSPIAHYHVQYSTWNTAGAGSCSGNWLPASPWESANSHFQTNQLDENQAYCFRVLAFNGVFESDWAAVSPTNPGAPTGLTVDPDSDHTHLSWSAPASDGGALITHYHVQYSTWNTAGAGSCSSTWQPSTPLSSTSTSIQVNSLSTTTVYCYRVQAVNGVGQSGWATVSPTRPGIPTAWASQARTRATTA